MDDFSISEDTIVTNTQTARTLRRADVVFLLDCTGTMKTILRAVTSAISEVVDLYSKSKVQIRLGLVEYRDTTQESDAHLNRMHFHTFAGNSILLVISMSISPHSRILRQKVAVHCQNQPTMHWLMLAKKGIGMQKQTRFSFFFQMPFLTDLEKLLKMCATYVVLSKRRKLISSISS